MNDKSILVRHLGEERWVDPDMHTYRDEDHLQSLLKSDPGRIPGVGDEARTARELGTSAGPVDVIAVDVDGSITVVECKLAANPEKRRMVLGQVVDYASAIWQDGHEAFLRSWQRKTGESLAELLDDEAALRLRSNIDEGRIHLCLAVDAIDAELRRLIEYLNVVTSDYVSVTALELSYALHGQVEILIPSTYGGEIAESKARTIGRVPVHWTWQKFLDAIATTDDRTFAEELRRRTEALEQDGARDPMWFGRMPGGWVFLHLHGRHLPPLALWVNKDGRLLVYGTWTSFTSYDVDVFTEIAEALGLDPAGSSGGVAASELDLDELWKAALDCSDKGARERSDT